MSEHWGVVVLPSVLLLLGVAVIYVGRALDSLTALWNVLVGLGFVSLGLAALFAFPADALGLASASADGPAVRYWLLGVGLSTMAFGGVVYVYDQAD